MSEGAPRRKLSSVRRAGADDRRVAIALAGGGPLGAMYEIGVVRALAESLEGIDFNALDAYVGVSAGGFVAAGLANGIEPARMYRLVIDGQAEDGDPAFDPAIFLQPALGEYIRRALSVPPLLMAAWWELVSSFGTVGPFEAFQRLTRTLPTGLFDNEPIDHLLSRLYNQPGRSNDFRRLARKLFIVATDLDTGESVPFGAPGHDHIPISRAVQASAALPGLYPPVKIGNRYFVDGALQKTLHASVALEQGAKLVICVNPLVPFDAALHAARGGSEAENLVARGLPTVLSQTFRSLIHSRLEAGIRRYASEFPAADIVLFEPTRDDADMFYTNMFSYVSRRRLAAHAYRRTVEDLQRRHDELAPIFARHGIRLRRDLAREPAGAAAYPASGAAVFEWLNEYLASLARTASGGYLAGGGSTPT